MKKYLTSISIVLLLLFTFAISASAKEVSSLTIISYGNGTVEREGKTEATNDLLAGEINIIKNFKISVA